MPGIKKVVLILVVVFIIAGGAGCLNRPQESTGEERIAMKVGAMPDEATLPYYVAAREGIFAEHGLDVEVVPFMSALERDSALIAGQIDAGENDPVGVLVLRNAGYNIRIVSTELHETPEKMRFAILASPNSNIRSVEDLEGKKIAISRNTIIEWVTDALLGGVQTSKIEEKRVPIRLQMLLADQVDAATLAEPLASYAIHQGARLLISDSMLDETISHTVIVFRGDFIEAHPESVDTFLHAYNEAVDRINANPENYRALVVEIAKVPEEIAGSYQMATYMKAEAYPRDNFEAVLNWMQSRDLVTQELLYEDVIYHSA
ncbi:MAG: transporter substrate-binding domain-containing protein [Methanophagales archaeon ANME-1-THS]|nr:MAG: transporter substrate-binding domain-containing protein [Methanophagales archaeon ANME-1-THS]